MYDKTRIVTAIADSVILHREWEKSFSDSSLRTSRTGGGLLDFVLVGTWESIDRLKFLPSSTLLSAKDRSIMFAEWCIDDMEQIVRFGTHRAGLSDAQVDAMYDFRDAVRAAVDISAGKALYLLGLLDNEQQRKTTEKGFPVDVLVRDIPGWSRPEENVFSSTSGDGISKNRNLAAWLVKDGHRGAEEVASIGEPYELALFRRGLLTPGWERSYYDE